MLLGKNLTSSDILQETKNLHLINHPYSQGDNFHLKNWSPLNTFKIKNQRYVPELKKKKKAQKCIFLKKRSAIKIENQTFPFKLTLLLCAFSGMHFLFFTGFRNICWFFKNGHRTIHCLSPKSFNLLSKQFWNFQGFT